MRLEACETMRLTIHQCTNAFYIQSPRLRNAVPESITETVVVHMPAFLAKCQCMSISTACLDRIQW